MNSVETLNEGLKREYRMTVKASDIEARIGDEVKALAPTVRMPGFRPGKVPANLIRKMHGPALMQDALNKAIDEGVRTLMAEHQLRPAIQPGVTLADGYEPGKDAELTVSLEVLPTIATPDIDGLKLERLVVPADDAAVDAAVERIVGQMKRFEAAADGHAAEMGDQVLIDFEGKVDGVPFDGGKGEGMAVELGAGQLIPGFEDQLVGIKVGDDCVLNVTFPDEYPAANLAGKAATFDVTATEVKRPATTVADDDFAKSLGLESLEKLRELMKDQVEQETNGLTRTHMKRKLLDQLAASHDFDVPPSMVEAEFNQIWNQLMQEAANEADPDAARAELEAEKEEYRGIAVRRVRLGLLLSEIGQANNVQVSNQEMSRLIAQAAQQYRAEDRERFMQYIQQDQLAAAQLRAPLYEDKVVDFLFSKAEITEREVSREEIEAAIEADDDTGHVHGPDCNHDHGHSHVEPAPKAKKAKAKPATDGEAAPVEAKPAKAKKAKDTPVAADDAPAPDAAAEKPKRAKKTKVE